jgi:S1-C subfamily serine protease
MAARRFLGAIAGLAMVAASGTGVRSEDLAKTRAASIPSVTMHGAMGLLPQASFADVLAAVIPSVVTIRVTSEEPVPAEIGPGLPEIDSAPVRRKARSGGSGVIVDAAAGHVLTNNHVIDGAVAIDVVLADGRLVAGRLIGRDIGTDLAVVAIEPRGLRALPIGNSDAVRVGDVVLAIGNPFGLEGTATMGIVSASMRTEIGHEAFEDFFQIDAVINPGNSGGALVNTRGELVAINTATAGASGNVGIGFAIPVNMARIVKDEILRHGRMRRGALGLIVEDLSYERAAAIMSGTNRGALVTAVVPGSPAAAAGITPGAIVTEVGGKPVRGAAELKTRVVTVALGTELTLVVRRDGKDEHYGIRTAEVSEAGPEHVLSAAEGGLDGLVVADIAPGNPLFGDVRGAEVLRLRPDSPAAGFGIRAGDVIVGIDGSEIRHIGHLFRHAERTGMSYRLRVQRKGLPGWLRIVR